MTLHSLNRFQEKVLAHGNDRMAADVNVLNSLNEHMEEECNFKTLEISQLSEEFRPRRGRKRGIVNQQPFPEDTRLADWCRRYSMKEVALLREAREAQEQRARENLRKEGRGQFIGFRPKHKMHGLQRKKAQAAAAAAADLLAGLWLPPGMSREAVRDELDRVEQILLESEGI